MKKNTVLLNAEQLSLILNISEFTVKKLAQAKELPCMYVNRRPQFNMDALIKHFKKLEWGAA
ncbi:MAG: helix-turn-helix domain-containing protein [Treponema sp.]|jgi:hypothetical protein|nr:helix-turn-helix domain-containing protein [Treponema sp.]